MSKKTNKILILIIAVLAVVIIGLVIALVYNNSQKTSDKNNSNLTTEANSTEDENITEATSEEKNQDTNTEEGINTGEDINVSISKSNGWTGDNNTYYAQLDISIFNESTNSVDNWIVKLPNSNGIEVDSKWNCEISNSNGYIEVTSVDYNKEITSNNKISDIGIIIVCKNENDVNEIINSSILFIDGKEYINSNTNAIGEGTEEQKTEETTTEEDNKPIVSEEGTPFDNHGKLQVEGTDIIDKNGDKYQLKGVSTHGIAWFPDYVNKDAFMTFRDDWGVNLIRIAMYTAESGGYCTDGDKEYLKELVDKGVNDATELGLYVIVDWHILHDTNPLDNKEEAKKYFDEVSSKYSKYDNVIYEICNEPNGGTTWSDIKSYAEEIIPIIRANHKDAIIIVGTPTWSQDVDIASSDPITGYDNIMYAVHFYAATHTDNIRNKVKTAINKGLPIFVSEFSICDASGNGAIDYEQADKWFELINNNNLSYAGWNVSNKNETSSLIKSSCTKTSGWTDDDLSETGIWLKNTIQGK